jgi:hypothetical protein
MQCFGITKKFKRCKKPAGVIFCNIHKFQPLILLISIIGFISSIAGLYRDAVEPIIHTTEFRATVTPSQIKPSLDNWENHHRFTINNPGPAPIYAIWLQLSVIEQRSTSNRVEIETKIKSDDGRSFQCPIELKAPPEAVLITGKSAKGNASLFIVIRALDPGQSKSFDLTTKSNSPIDTSKISVTYNLSILSESSGIDRFKRKVKEVKLYFDKMPKGLTINALNDNYFAVLCDE